jgi:hypothetical protein
MRGLFWTGVAKGRPHADMDCTPAGHPAWKATQAERARITLRLAPRVLRLPRSGSGRTPSPISQQPLRDTVNMATKYKIVLIRHGESEW